MNIQIFTEKCQNIFDSYNKAIQTAHALYPNSVIEIHKQGNLIFSERDKYCCLIEGVEYSIVKEQDKGVKEINKD